MTYHDLRFWLQATPFQPFKITLTSGHVYEVRHPKLVDLFKNSLLLKTPSGEEGVLDHAEMIGLNLIERIAPVEAGAAHD